MRRFSLLLLVGITASCVTQKKYDDLNDRTSSLIVENQELKDSVNVAVVSNQELANKLGVAKEQIEDLSGDTTQLGQLYRELIDQYKKLNNVSKADAQNLSKQLEKVGEMTVALQRKDNLLKREHKIIDSLTKNLEEREARVAELQQKIEDSERRIQVLNDKIAEALNSFKDSGMTVKVEDGKVYVTLDESLLFQSGSYELDQKGKSALSKLAGVLKEQKDISVVVEGHTDDVPYVSNGGKIKDNWDLSVLRSTTVVREIQKKGVNPNMISAAGRGPYAPKVEGKTKETRAKNRRTEIIISPKLDELYNIIENK